jgi:hypothetical protein
LVDPALEGPQGAHESAARRNIVASGTARRSRSRLAPKVLATVSQALDDERVLEKIVLEDDLEIA